MNTKGLKIICISLFIFNLSACTPKAKDIEIKKDKFVFEYGTKIKIKPSEVLDTKDKKVLKSAKFGSENILNREIKEVGKYTITISFIDKNEEKKKHKLNIEVKDTILPTFSKFSEKITIYKGDTNNYYSDYFQGNDLSACTIKIDSSLVDVNTVGSYTIVVEVSDSHKNVLKKEAIIEVIERAVAVANDTPTLKYEPFYVQGILVVNKKHPLSSDYAPGENPEAGNAIRTLIADMKAQGYDVNNSYSGFRSYKYQASLYQNYVNTYGQASADTFSARAGYSEHQTGLSFDLLHSSGALVVGANEVNWIANNAQNYGFIVRYKPGKEWISGYQAEPWHLRYVGSAAPAISQSGLSLEEYLGVSGGSY